MSDAYPFEKKVMQNNVMQTGKVFRGAIVSFDSGEVRATGPVDFMPDPQAIDIIIQALNGDIGPISEEGVNLGGGCRVNTPAKLEEGKSIYCSDGQGGGCAIFKTKECVLILVYNAGAAQAIRLGQEVAEFMEEDNNI